MSEDITRSSKPYTRRSLTNSEIEDLVFQLARKFLHEQCPYCDSTLLEWDYWDEDGLGDCARCQECDSKWHESRHMSRW